MIKGEFVNLVLKDVFSIKGRTYNNRKHIQSSVGWLSKAQDEGVDGGVSAWYGIFSGWSEPYIETTGYIISTFLETYHLLKDKIYLDRAIKMADFLVSVQLEIGGYKTYLNSNNKKDLPTIFNTGQDLIGMVDIYNETGNIKYLQSLTKAADFLCMNINKDGAWKKYSYDGKGHSYDSRVSYALIKAYKVTKNKKYKQGALLGLNWAMRQQQLNGWFKNAQLPPPNPIVPYTHTISYTIEGLLCSGILLNDSKLINSSKKAADAILDYYSEKGFIPGTFDSKWSSDDKYTCVTGDAQISVVWSILYLLTGQSKYLNASEKINEYLKSLNCVDSKNNNIRGSMPGSYPIYGDLIRGQGYCRLSLINWAVKFFTDAILLNELIKTNSSIKYIGK